MFGPWRGPADLQFILRHLPVPPAADAAIAAPVDHSNKNTISYQTKILIWKIDTRPLHAMVYSGLAHELNRHCINKGENNAGNNHETN
jgi:hypothetical protein